MHVHFHTALAEFPIISHLTYSLLPVQIADPRTVYMCMMYSTYRVVDQRLPFRLREIPHVSDVRCGFKMVRKDRSDPPTSQRS